MKDQLLFQKISVPNFSPCKMKAHYLPFCSVIAKEEFKMYIILLIN